MLLEHQRLELVYRSHSEGDKLVECVIPLQDFELFDGIPHAIRINDFTKQQVERRSLAETRLALEKADRVFFVMSAQGIGDGVIATAYLSAMQEGFSAIGINPPTTILKSSHTNGLFDFLKDKDNELIDVPARSGLGWLRKQLDEGSDRRVVVLDFEGMNVELPKPLLPKSFVGERLTFAYRLFPTMLTRYTTRTDGLRRFANPIEDFLSLLRGTIDPEVAQPRLALSSDSDNIYQEVVQRHSLDPATPQVAVIVESTMNEKRYPFPLWVKVIDGILHYHPNLQISIIYDPRYTSKSFLKDQLTDKDGLRGIHLVSGSLNEMAVFLSRQRLVLSNDTGLAHIAAAVEGGPPVITVFQSEFFTSDVWISSQRQIGIPTTKNSPDSIVKKALEVLNS